MDSAGGSKVTGIKQVSKLKEFLQKLHHATSAPKDSQNEQSEDAGGGITPDVSYRLRSSNVYCDSDEDSCQSLEMPNDVPRGFLAVYVGKELRRFIIPTSYLSDPLFKVLLEKVEEEFGFNNNGALTIPCDTETFKYLLQCMENHRKVQAEETKTGQSVCLMFSCAQLSTRLLLLERVQHAKDRTIYSFFLSLAC